MREKDPVEFLLDEVLHVVGCEFMEEHRVSDTCLDVFVDGEGELLE